MDVLKIALTGGIASGKSEVSRLFGERKISVIDADKIARDLFKSGAPLLNDLREKFGDSIFTPSQELDRKALGKVVFNSPKDLKWLNDLTHPKVALEIKHQLTLVCSAYVILDIPLLIKPDGTIPAHLSQFIDRILVVSVNENTQVKRVTKRDNIDEAQARKIMSSQSTLQQKLALADDVINNNGSLSQLESQVDLLHNRYMSLAKG